MLCLLDFGLEIHTDQSGYVRLYTTVHHRAGDVVLDLGGDTHPRGRIHSRDGVLVLGDRIKRSFSPSCYEDGPCLKAVLDLSPGTEITLDIEESELEMDRPFALAVYF